MRPYFLMIVIALAAIAATLMSYKERDSYRCRTCRWSQNTYQWRLGSWGDASIPIAPKWQQIEESHFYHDFYPTDHVHEWQFAQGAPYYVFGTAWGGCAIGAGRHTSEIFQLYESDGGFRAALQTKMREGTLPRAVVSELLAMPKPLANDDARLYPIYQSLINAPLNK